ncbi:MAG: hypothetical protein WC008_02590 [Bacilli bacterium]
MKFRDYFTNEFHTAEDHYIPSLRSRYYRSTLANAIEAIKEIAKKHKGVIKHVDDVRGEILFDSQKFSANVIITSTSYTETAVDLLITTYGILPLGKGKKIIEQIYTDIDKKLPFKGVSLYKG